MWSLIHEFRISLIFPVMAHLVSLRKPLEVLTSTLIFSLSAKLALHFLGMAHWWSTLLDTCQYLFFFMAGAEMARHRGQLSGLFNRASALTRTAVCAGSLLLLNARWELPSALSELSAVCYWAGAILIVGFTLASAGQAKLLRWQPLLWLGTISYSLYLTHCLVLMAGLFAFQTVLPTVFIVVCVPAVSLGVAALVYRVIELPAMLLARRMTSATTFERRLPRATKVLQ
jgi:peptidoglycan/LPS O-acetylase OafA/YrhL